MTPKNLNICITLTEEALGMMPSTPEIHREFIASKAPDAASLEQEVADQGVEQVVAAGTTVFPRDAAGQPFWWDYQLKGWCKDCCGALSRVPGSRSSKVKAWRKVIDGLVFPQPRKVPIQLPDGGGIGRCERPLRASTAQGERVALAASETVPAGSTFTFTLRLLDPGLEGLVKEWLDYGALRGFGQWRNSGKGRFTYTLSE